MKLLDQVGRDHLIHRPEQVRHEIAERERQQGAERDGPWNAIHDIRVPHGAMTHSTGGAMRLAWPISATVFQMTAAITSAPPIRAWSPGYSCNVGQIHTHSGARIASSRLSRIVSPAGISRAPVVKRMK